jgi:hypothetical protein
MGSSVVYFSASGQRAAFYGLARHLPEIAASRSEELERGFYALHPATPLAGVLARSYASEDWLRRMFRR